MAKKKSQKKAAGIKVPVKTDVSSVEADTIQRTGRTISAIESFLAKWEASDIKNKVMLPHIKRIKKFHKELVDWKKKALKSQGRDNDRERLKRLHEFVIICRNYG